MLKLPKILAVDFDGTLVEDEFPDIGKPKWDIVLRVKKLQEQGWKTVLWTCRDDNTPEENLSKAVNYCTEVLDLKFDAVNTNIDEVKEMFINDTRKVYADYYLDDKNLPILGGRGHKPWQ